MGKGTILLVIAGALMGVAAGIGSYTFVYARGSSYLTDDPSACANCHVMQAQYDGWRVSPHRSVAVCNDCHTPPGLIPKYATKALNGYHETIQERTFQMRGMAMDALIALIGDIRKAQTSGMPADRLKQARDYQRKAQFFLDFIEAESSMGFHAPQEAGRVLAQSIDFSRKGQATLAALTLGGTADPHPGR